MKKLDLDNITKKFADIGFMINPTFLQKETVDAPILGQVDLLLKEIRDKGAIECVYLRYMLIGMVRRSS